MSYPEDRYAGDKGESNAVLTPAGGDPDLTIGDVSSVRYLATGASTDGQFGLYRWDTGPQRVGPGPHFHKSITESFFILSGTMRIFDGERWFDANTGDFAYVPQGGIHAFRNESGAPVSMLLLFTPGAPREPYFEALADAAQTGRQMSGEELLDLWRRHDTYPA